MAKPTDETLKKLSIDMQPTTVNLVRWLNQLIGEKYPGCEVDVRETGTVDRNGTDSAIISFETTSGNLVQLSVFFTP